MKSLNWMCEKKKAMALAIEWKAGLPKPLPRCPSQGTRLPGRTLDQNKASKFLEVVLCLIGFPHGSTRRCPVEISRGHARVDFNGPGKIGHSFLVFLDVRVGVAAVVVSLGIHRVDLNGLVIVHNRAAVFFHLGVGVTPVVESFHIQRVNLDGPGVVRECILVIFQLIVGIATVVICRGVSRVGFNDLGVIIDRGMVIPRAKDSNPFSKSFSSSMGENITDPFLD